jgi:CubicO group peptidase (beta-lactamase class C family)
MRRVRVSLVVLIVLAVTAMAPAASAWDDAIDDYIKAEMERRHIPGLALAVARDGKLVKARGYGVANVEHEAPVTPDTVFELASITKQFTATAIMLLVEEGKVQLDDPISSYLPDAPEKWKSITGRHLLTHTSGLPGLTDGFKALQSADRYTTANIYAAARQDTLSFTAGDRWQYSDVGYFLLGMIIERASGRKYRDVLEQRFFKPLGMTATSVIDVSRVVKHRADNYTLRDGQLVRDWRVWDVELPSHYGVLSTVKDLVTWEAALTAGKVVKPASLAQMWTPVRLNSVVTFPYGFGWGVDERRGHRWISHTGITGTELSRFPDDNVTVVVLTNLGRTLSPTNRVNSWGLTYGVAGRYIKGLLVGREKPRRDPDATRTTALRETLQEYARGDEPLAVLPLTRSYFTLLGRTLMAERLKTMKEFTFMTCDDVSAKSMERHGARVARVCHYRLVNAEETRYYSFWLRADDVVVDFWSSTE